MFGTASLFYFPVKLFRSAPFSFLVPISLFLEKIPRQGALSDDSHLARPI